jgi:hypothetical protein
VETLSVWTQNILVLTQMLIVFFCLLYASTAVLSGMKSSLFLKHFKLTPAHVTDISSSLPDEERLIGWRGEVSQQVCCSHLLTDASKPQKS